MPETRAMNVANYLVAKFQDSGSPITNLKLQKLLYYAQGWYLALYDKELFGERIEAWPHGPVVPPVYGNFKYCQWNPIVDRPTNVEVPTQVAPHLDEVMQVFGIYDAYTLERMTHREQPWVEARAGLPDDVPSNNVITPDAMRQYFKTVHAQNGADQTV